MYNKKPPFEITSAILDEVAEIAELVGQVTAVSGLSSNPMLRRTNRIRTIHASLAIEQNTLSLEQVTAVLNGAHIIGPPRDIAAAKNAYETYDMLDRLNPFSMDDLLKAHGVMTRGLVEESGCFRSGPVGVVDGEGRVLHFGTLPAYVPDNVSELMQWVQNSNFHMLIKSCVFHYELELIHPFADGNGRIGRLWHTLLLIQWKPLFAWLPVESIIHDRQAEYYHAINRSNSEGSSTAFLLFMLSAIKEALTEAVQTDGAAARMTAEELRRSRIDRFLAKNSFITNEDVRRLFQVSAATASRILAALTAEGMLRRIRTGRSWSYERADSFSPHS